MQNGLNSHHAISFQDKTIHLTQPIDASSYLWTPIGVNGFNESSIAFDEDSMSCDEFWGPPAWTFIGNFNGHFNGHNNLITGLHTNNNKYMIGLFGCSLDTIENVDISEGYLKGRSNIGGISGHNAGLIKNCSNSCEIIGDSNVAGIVGYNNDSGSIHNCKNKGLINGNYSVGGISGLSNHSNYSEIKNCINFAEIYGQDSIGGILGYLLSDGLIINCCNDNNADDNFKGIGNKETDENKVRMINRVKNKLNLEQNKLQQSKNTKNELHLLQDKYAEHKQAITLNLIDFNQALFITLENGAQ